MGKYSFLCSHPDCPIGVHAPEPNDQVIFRNTKLVQVHHHEKHSRQEDLIISCKLCGEQFPSKAVLTHHLEKKHHRGKRKMMCTICGLTLSSKSAYQSHEMRHKRIKIQCDECDFATVSTHSLKRHKMNIHAKSEEERQALFKFKCEICGKRFMQNDKLKEHINRHTNEITKECDVCGRTLKLDNYKPHMMNVHGVKLPCDICEKPFFSKLGLKIHKREMHGVDSF